MSRLLSSFLVAASLLLVGCGTTITERGDRQQIRYSVYTHTYVDADNLDDVAFLVGPTTTVSARLTTWGVARTEDPEDVRHRSTDPALHVSNTSVDGAPGKAQVRADEAGTYPLESLEGDRLVDRVGLHFAVPTRLEVSGLVERDGEWVVASPDTDSTFRVGDVLTDISVVAHDPEGRRILGDLEVRIESSRPYKATSDTIPDSSFLMWDLDDGGEAVWFGRPGRVMLRFTTPHSDAEFRWHLEIVE